MSAKNTDLSREPAPDQAEHNAFFPSPYSLSQYTAPKTDYDGTDYSNRYSGGKWKVLMIGTDERYLIMKNGKMFSTGNHPVETLVPMLHIDKAGFEIDVATVSGNPVKFEMWAMPREDHAVRAAYEKYLPQFKEPKRLSHVIEQSLGANSQYIAVLVPGGHGALTGGISDSREMKTVLEWAIDNDKHIITLCHGPACLLAAGVGSSKESYIFNGYEICVFPDALDEGANIEIGYIPGHLRWLLAESLEKLGVKVMNDNMTGAVHQDRRLLTGDSPLASNALGKLAAGALLKEFGN
ncbi:MAG: protein deglycase HchA [Nitrospirales bacterium]|nr:protein deglycase HchA [Nitrospirales bacterium]